MSLEILYHVKCDPWARKGWAPPVYAHASIESFISSLLKNNDDKHSDLNLDLIILLLLKLLGKMITQIFSSISIPLSQFKFICFKCDLLNLSWRIAKCKKCALLDKRKWFSQRIGSGKLF